MRRSASCPHHPFLSGTNMHTSTPPADSRSNRHQIRSLLESVRRRTHNMVDPLSWDEVHKQFDSIMSPVVWDIGHVGNFEEYWLLREIDGRDAHDSAYDEMYDPFDNPRFSRGDLPLLDRDAAYAYLADVRADAFELLAKTNFDPDAPLLRDGYIYAMVLQHEAQHQETILQALDLRQDLEPYVVAADRRLARTARQVDDEERVSIPQGRFTMGTDDRFAAYDNERPAHSVHVGAFSIDKFPATARRYAAFIGDRGYEREDLWTAEGWEWLRAAGEGAPQGWIPDLGGGWLIRRFGHVRPLDPMEPVQHVSFHEAQAFAAWAGARLPTEPEWEKAAAWDEAAQGTRTYPWGEAPASPALANLDHDHWGPALVGSYPMGASAYGVEQLLGDTYEWTSCWFDGYAGYATFPYPEYSEVFFGEHCRVLRGASWATSPKVARNTFRNWDFAARRQIMSGIRLAWDVA
jgi:iron(II)-dependent oxidoreductase